MSIDDERALTDTGGTPRVGDEGAEVGLTDERPAEPAEIEDFIEDEPTTATAPEDYDFGAMVAGVKPNRVRVQIRPRSDLYDTLQSLAERYRELDGQEVPADVLADLDAEWEEIKAAYDQTFTVVIEGRSSDWVRETFRQLRKRGIDPDKPKLGDQQKKQMNERRLNAQLALQIVHPTQGVTEESIAALAAANEVEANKLYMALVQVNTRPMGDADFLRGR